jgi:hypothetical protein
VLCADTEGAMSWRWRLRTSPTVEPGGESVESLYRQLACERASRALATLARERGLERLLAQSAQTLEDAAAVLLNTETALLGNSGSAPHALSKEAGALLALAAHFEQAADLARSGTVGGEQGTHTHDR